MTIQQEIEKTEEARKFVLESGLVTDSVIKIYDDKLAKLRLQLQQSSEKKNDLASNVEQSADATSADARQQSSTTKPSGDNLDVAVHSVNVANNPVLSEKWVGLAHESKFKSTDAYEQFMKCKTRLKTLVTNWLNSKRKRDADLKKNLAIDLCREMTRVVNNDAKAEYKPLLIGLKFSVTHDHTRYQYGCDETLLDNIFKLK